MIAPIAWFATAAQKLRGIGYAGLVSLAGVIAAAFLLGRCSVDATSICDSRNLTDLVKQQAAERRADAVAGRERVADAARASAQQRPVEEAIHGMPDAVLSTRQRARACVVLRQQGADQPALTAAGC